VTLILIPHQHDPRPGLGVMQQPAVGAAGLDDASPPRMIHGLPRNGASPIGALGRPYGGANGAWPGYTAGQVRSVPPLQHDHMLPPTHLRKPCKPRAASMPSV